ncbi:hypothetical protein [Amycolatopsis sp. NPDC004079]
MPIGFAAAMIGLFLWTLDHQVMWMVLGFTVTILCWVRSNATDDDAN